MRHPPEQPAAPVRRHWLAALGFAALSWTGCAQPPPAAIDLDQPIVLLGETHDNEVQHALRRRALEAKLATGARPALVMEQFDRERQGVIDTLRARTPPPDADALIAAAGGPGWSWPLYRPFVELALRHDLPLVAAGVSREDARRIMRDGLAASGFDPAVPADIVDAQARSIQDSHCDALDEQTARRMALAQVARDQQMARALRANAARGAVLLAGNGHVRTDAGVPRWLHPDERARSAAIGLLEDGMVDGGRYDRIVRTPAQPRPDPCAAPR